MPAYDRIRVREVDKEGWVGVVGSMIFFFLLC